MATATAPAGGPGRPMTEAEARRLERTRADETKPARKTTEFYIYLASVAAVLLASWLVGEGDGDRDWFRSDRAWWYITLLTIGYLVSRGLAKSGSRTRNDDNRTR